MLFCDSKHEEVNKGSLYFWIYCFYLSKYYELLDTVILCLRKVRHCTSNPCAQVPPTDPYGDESLHCVSRSCIGGASVCVWSSLSCDKQKELRFLHAYHHWATLILIYVCLEVALPVQWIAEWLNSLVHIPMYYYYLISVLGVKDVWWKVHYCHTLSSLLDYYWLQLTRIVSVIVCSDT